jgi:hypothetical protein
MLCNLRRKENNWINHDAAPLRGLWVHNDAVRASEQAYPNVVLGDGFDKWHGRSCRQVYSTVSYPSFILCFDYSFIYDLVRVRKNFDM